MYGTGKTGRLLLNQTKMLSNLKVLWQNSLGCNLCTQKSVTRPASYCKRRLQIWNRKFIHTAAVYSKADKASDTKSVPEKHVPPGTEPDNSLHEALVERMEAPKPDVLDKELNLPTDDVKRITPENRRLAMKASLLFEDLAVARGANKQTFHLAVKTYLSQESLYRRGAVEFIYAGLAEMKRFGVVKDLEAYKALLQVLPEGKMIPRNVWQVEFMHYPRQQQCGIDLLEQMEQSAVLPDDDFGRLLNNRFGSAAHVTRKLRRMMYWLPKFKNMNPYPIPRNLPDDPIKLALLALQRMCVDRETEFQVFKTAEVDPASEEDTFIASAQSPTQQQLLSKHDSQQPVFVEGPFPVYLRDIGQQYFLLRAEPNINALMKEKERRKAEENDDNLFEWTNFFEEEKCDQLQPILSVHEQEDSTILALSITGTSSKSSLVTWIRCLEKHNPNLADTPVLFKLISPDSALDVIGDNRPFKELQER